MRRMFALLFALLPLAAIAQAPAELLLSPTELQARLGAPDLVLLHVGNPAGYEAAHLPGARLVPQGGLSAPRGSDPAALILELPDAETLRTQLQQLGIARESRVVVYFARDEFPAATRVIHTLDAAGWGDRVSLLDGGLPAWQALGLPVTQEVPSITPTSLPPLRLAPRSVDAAFIEGNAANPAVALIDARAPAFYTGAETSTAQAEPRRAGHLPGARNVPSSAVTDESLRMKSPDELSKLFAAAKAEPGRKLVVYCHVGQQATAVMFAARLAGLDPVLYDGSFQEWAQSGRPLAVGAEP